MALNNANERETPWLTPWRFATLLAALIFVSWPGIILGLQSFIYRDFGFFSAPLAWHWRESFRRLEWPLWNPLSNCGQPFLAQWNTQVLYPPGLFYLLLPFPWSLEVFNLLHVFLAGFGMFCLARDWTKNNFGSALAGVIFAFNGVMLSSVLWPSIVVGLGWMPWVVWLVRRAWRNGGCAITPAVFTGALQMLSGGVEVVLLTWVLLAALAVMDSVSLKGRWKIFLRFGVIVFLVSGLCAAQLLPFLDLLRHSERAGNYSGADSPMPPTGWVNFLLPLFRCKLAQGVFIQDGQYWLLSYYPGVITMALAALALWKRRRGEVWLFALLAVFCVVLAMGNATPLYPWLCRHVRLIGVIRFPVKFVILPIFVLPLLAAFAWQSEGTETKTTGTGRRWLYLWMATVAVICACLAWEFRLQPAHDENEPVLINGLIRLGFFSAIVIGLFVLEKSAGRPRWLPVLVLLLVWLDLDRQAPQPGTVNPSVLLPNMPRPLPPPQFGTGRAMIPQDVQRTLTFAVQPDPAQNFLSHRFALFSDCNLLDNIPKCDGFFPLNLDEHGLLNGDLDGPMRDFLGVTEMLEVRGNVLDWVAQPGAMPLLTGGQRPRFADDDAVLTALADTNFDPKAEVYLPSQARETITATHPATVKITAEKFAAEEIDATVDANAPAMLVVAQAYDHPWRAYVDGRRTPLWRANGAFQALQVPAGTHEVKLTYVDWNFRAGLIISLATLGGLLIYCGCPPRKKNESSAGQNFSRKLK